MISKALQCPRSPRWIVLTRQSAWKRPLIVTLTSIVPEPVEPTVDTVSYANLKRLIKDHGLLERRPARAIARMLIIDALLVLSIVFLLEVHVFWLQCLNALFLGFVSAQLGFNG